MSRRPANKKRPAPRGRKAEAAPAWPISPMAQRSSSGVSSAAPLRFRPTALIASGVGARPARAPRAEVHPGPSPLASALPKPLLARVGGSAGSKSALEFVSGPFAAVSELSPQAVAVTYWFEPPKMEGEQEVVVQLTGRRLDVEGARAPEDDFVSVASLSGARLTSGRTSLTHRVSGKAPGRWHVTAEATAVIQGGGRADAVRLPPAEAVGRSTFAPVASALAPGVVVGAWPAMVSLGVVFALTLQGVLAQKHGLASASVLALAALAVALGAVGAKVYYRVTHWRESGGRLFAGLSVQGFVIVATATFVIGGVVQGLAVGHLLDATVPALLLGQAVGRLGCLMGGCCAGVPTHSRWGVWSSDRRVGTHRIPVQLLESGAAALLAAATGAIARSTPTSAAGLLFVGGLAAYVAVRQLLFPLRGIPRATRHGRQATLVTALLTLAAVVTVSVAL